MHSTCRAFFLVFLCLAIAGCGSGRPPMGKVKGTVNYKGQPVANGAITFEVAGNRPASGKISSGEIIDVVTFEPNDGVPVGTAKVAVIANSAVASSAPPAGSDPGVGTKIGADYMGGNAKPLIPAKYNNPKTSGLTFEIKKGDNDLGAIDLKD
jgi:hypothetical protein